MFWVTMTIAASLSLTGLALLCVGICKRQLLLGVIGLGLKVAGMGGYLIAISINQK